MNGKIVLSDIPPEAWEKHIIGGARAEFTKLLDGLNSLVTAWADDTLNDKTFARQLTQRLDSIRRFITIKKNGETK